MISSPPLPYLSHNPKCVKKFGEKAKKHFFSLDKSKKNQYNNEGKSMYDAVVAQSVEHILGKDEVGSSNLLNSSKNPETKVSGFFCVK